METNSIKLWHMMIEELRAIRVLLEKQQPDAKIPLSKDPFFPAEKAKKRGRPAKQ